MVPSDRWPAPKEPPPGLGPPVFMGPITLPNLPHKRRWGWLLVWTLVGFAGGVAAGPTLTGQALALAERAYSTFGRSSPKFGQTVTLVASAPTHAPAAPTVVPLPSPPPGVEEAGDERGEGAKPTGSEKPAGAAAPQPAARSPHTKSEARTPSGKAAPARTTASTDVPAPAPAGFHDPFVEGAGPANQPKAAGPSRKAKPSFDEPAPTAKSEPAPKPAASTSSDPLDSLMADVVTDTKGKGRQREGKGLDAILKDVQKSKAEPSPKSEAPAALPPLSQADISRVMAGVKTRSKDCARQLGQKGVAELKLTVSKDGNVTDVRVGGKLANTPVGACIEKAARAASFPRSAGLRFDYGIDVR